METYWKREGLEGGVKELRMHQLILKIPKQIIKHF